MLVSYLSISFLFIGKVCVGSIRAVLKIIILQKGCRNGPTMLRTSSSPEA